nr:McrC family protein [Nocardia rhizosphaerihabitans]
MISSDGSGPASDVSDAGPQAKRAATSYFSSTRHHYFCAALNSRRRRCRIGSIYRDGRILEIRPRLGIETIAAWAGAALNVRIVPDSAEHGPSPGFVAELLAAAWRATVTSAALHGPPALRAPVRHVSPHVRGRLDIPATLALRSTRSPNVVSTSRPKQLDNLVASTIVLADRVLDRALRRTGWRGQRIDELLPQLKAAIGSRPALPTQRSLARVRYTPTTLPFAAPPNCHGASHAIAVCSQTPPTTPTAGSLSTSPNYGNYSSCTAPAAFSAQHTLLTAPGSLTRAHSCAPSTTPPAH